MNDEMMKCATCGTERVSRYAAYCHVCGSPLPELPPTPEDQAALNSQGQPPPNEEGYGYTSAPADAAPVPPPVHPQQQGYAATPPPGAAPEPAPPPPPGGPVRVYDRPDVPPSVVRRRKLTIVMAVIGVVISLLLLGLGPLRTALSARNEPVWSPPGTETPIGSIGLTGTVTSVAGLPPGMSAAQATARARQSTATVGPTWTPGVDLGTAAAGETAPIALPTLAPAATTTPRPTAAAAPSATLAPSATSAPATPAPAATAPVGATATSGVPATVAAGALPAALSGGRALAFVSDRSGSPQVWVMDAAGTSQLQVTRQGTNTSPVWSPDNRFLYYIGERNGEKAAYRLDITRGTEERVAADPSLVSIRPLPGGELAILRTENGLHSLYVGDRRLFQLDRSFQFQFSTDGRRVVIDPNSAAARDQCRRRCDDAGDRGCAGELVERGLGPGRPPDVCVGPHWSRIRLCGRPER